MAEIAAGKRDARYLGNLDAVRDWGYAPEYVAGMWAMLQHAEPGDDVFATGTAYTIRDFSGFAFSHVGLDWEKYVRFDERYLRPAEVDSLIGDASRAASILGWTSKVMTPRTSADHGRGGLCRCLMCRVWRWRPTMPEFIRWIVQGEATGKEQT